MRETDKRVFMLNRAWRNIDDFWKAIDREAYPFMADYSEDIMSRISILKDVFEKTVREEKF